MGGVYTLLPDIDLPSSRARRVFEVLSLATITVLLALYSGSGERWLYALAVVLSVVLLALWLVGHSGVVHSLVSAFLLSLPLYLLNPLLGGFAFLGYMTHLILDGEFF